MKWPRRALSLLNLLLLCGVGGLLCFYVARTVPPMLQDVHRVLGAQEASVEPLITQLGRLALSSEAGVDVTAHLKAISEAPLIDGIILTDADNRIVASAWLGEALPRRDALEKILHDNLRSWAFDGDQGRAGNVFVAFGQTLPGDLETEIGQATLVILGLALSFLVLLSLFIRDRLARQVRALRHATARIARGDYGVKVPVRGRGPMAELTLNFNKMAADLGVFTERLRTSEERFQLAVSGANEAIWDWDVQSNRLYLAPRFGSMLGYEEQELPGLFGAWERLMHPDDVGGFRESIRQHIRDHRPFQYELRFLRASGDWLWMLGRGEAVRDKAGAAVRMAGSFADITEKRATAEALRREKERLHVTLQSIADAVIATDTTGRVTFMNPAAQRLTGWPIEDARDLPISQVADFLSEFGAGSVTEALATGSLREEQGDEMGQSELVSRNGEKHIVEHSLAPLRNSAGEVIGGVIVIHDVTDRLKLMKQLTYQAIHDPLTQLVNRTGFEMRLRRTLKSASEEASVAHAICYLDLDQFKIVNDTCGHSAGDELLRQIAINLKRHVRKGDTLARLGGDEFGLILERCPLDKALEIAENMRRSVESFRFSWEEKSFSVGVSIGMAPFDGSPGYTAADIMSSVDQACYIAKSKGRNRIHTYQPGDNESSQWHREMQWVPHIHQAMDEQRFVLLAQPIVPLGDSDGQRKHYEILLRMRSPTTGALISPGSFLPAAERYDLMGMLDRWVVSQAIDMLAMACQFNSELATSTFGINISGAVLSDNSLLTFVKQALEKHNLPPRLLCFEITETVAIANFTHANNFVNELKEIGCQFALDDFGSGFASFSYLKTLPVDYLKIDGSFVRHLAENEIDHAMVDIINQLGHVMGLKTIAEFVENASILDALRRLNIDYAQGYYIGEPTSLEAVCFGDDGGTLGDARIAALPY